MDGGHSEEGSAIFIVSNQWQKGEVNNRASKIINPQSLEKQVLMLRRDHQEAYARDILKADCVDLER